MNMTTIFASGALVLGAAGLLAWKTFNTNTWHNPTPGMASFHDLSATTLDGDDFDFNQLKGKRVLIVNTASRCGYTPQYKPLEELHDMYKDQGLVILGFPCNQFGMQEPGSSSDIREFCSRNYGVSFQMMSKVKVKGDDQHPVYAWLTQKGPQRSRRPQGALELSQVPGRRRRPVGGRARQRCRSAWRRNQGVRSRRMTPSPAAYNAPAKKARPRVPFFMAPFSTSAPHSWENSTFLRGAPSSRPF